MSRFFYLLPLFWLIACQPRVVVLPTAQPTAALPTAAAVADLPPATPVLATPRATLAPPTAVPTATPVNEPALALTSPNAGATVPVTATLRVTGRAQTTADQTIEVAVLSLDNQLLAAAPATLSGLNNWQVDLALPTAVTGVAVVQATLYTAEGELLRQQRVPITLLPDTGDTRYLQLYRPTGIVTAVAGYNLFFDGYAYNPTRGLLTIAILDQNCQRQTAREQYTLRGSGYWQAFLLMPAQVEGFTCARLSFGEAGQDGRREIQLPLNALASDDPQAVGVVVNNPPDGAQFTGGQQVTLFGTAYNAPRGTVAITLLLEDGTLATSTAVTVDRYGYWELPLRLPTGYTGQIQLTAAIGTADRTLAEQILYLRVEE